MFRKLANSFKKKKKEKKALKLPRYDKAGSQKNEHKLWDPLKEGAPELLDTLFHSMYSHKEIKEILEQVERIERKELFLTELLMANQV